jgi:hypothetical protein
VETLEFDMDQPIHDDDNIISEVMSLAYVDNNPD